MGKCSWNWQRATAVAAAGGQRTRTPCAARHGMPPRSPHHPAPPLLSTLQKSDPADYQTFVTNWIAQHSADAKSPLGRPAIIKEFGAAVRWFSVVWLAQEVHSASGLGQHCAWAQSQWPAPGTQVLGALTPPAHRPPPPIPCCAAHRPACACHQRQHQHSAGGQPALAGCAAPWGTLRCTLALLLFACWPRCASEPRPLHAPRCRPPCLRTRTPWVA